MKELDNVLLSEVTETQKDKWNMCSHICGSKVLIFICLHVFRSECLKDYSKQGTHDRRGKDVLTAASREDVRTRVMG